MVSRQDAIAGGLKRYATEVPCKYGHFSERKTVNSNCVECDRIKDRLAYQKDSSKRIKQAKDWAKSNRDKRNRYYKKYATKYPEKIAVRARNRRIAVRGLAGTHSEKDINEIMLLQHMKCAYCKNALQEYHVDHIVPVASGGSNNRANLQILCPKCNWHKSAKDPIEFAQSMGFLL